MFTLDQRAGGLQKWKVPWKVLPSLPKRSESRGAREFAIILLRVYVQSLPSLSDVGATRVMGKLDENGEY